MNAFEEARKAWEGLSTFRAVRNRNKRFTYGQQWDDTVRDPETGKPVSERNLIARDGRPPLSNNLIRQMVKNIIGRYRMESESVVKTYDKNALPLTRKLRDIYLLHQLEELDCRLLEEFLISGVAVQRIGTDEYSRRKNLPLVSNVSPARLIVAVPSDPRGTDLKLIGMVHRMSARAIAARWCDGDRRRAAMLRQRAAETCCSSFGDTFLGDLSGGSFEASGDVAMVEVWMKEWKETFLVHDREKAVVYNVDVMEEECLRRENRIRKRQERPGITWRWHMEERWTGRWYLSDGTLLDTVENKRDEEPPFVVKMYPLIDGEVHSLVEDVIDQQKYVNRLVNLLDRMMATTAKGALLFPVDALPEGIDFEDITRQWSATDGVVVYRPSPHSPEPRQLNNSIGDIGARDLLKVEMQMFQDVSGVSDALAGRNVSGNVGAQRYDSEVRNATAAIRDLLDSFSSMITRRDLRLLGG